MTRRDELMIQRLLLADRRRIMVSPKTYRQLRRHPHFRFFMYRFGKVRDNHSYYQGTTATIAAWDEGDRVGLIRMGPVELVANDTVDAPVLRRADSIRSMTGGSFV